jgi:hypothetical protein
MTKNEKLKFEENKKLNYFKGFLAALLTDVVVLTVLLGYFIFGTRRIFAGLPFMSIELFVITQLIVIVFILLATLKLPWRRYKRDAVNYYYAKSDDCSYVEVISKFGKRPIGIEKHSKDGYEDYVYRSNHQLSITNDVAVIDSIESIKKNHVIILYTETRFDETVFNKNELKKRILVYCREDGFVYELRNKEFSTFKVMIRNIGFEMFKNNFRGIKRFKFRMIFEGMGLYLFQMY